MMVSFFMKHKVYFRFHFHIVLKTWYSMFHFPPFHFEFLTPCHLNILQIFLSSEKLPRNIHAVPYVGNRVAPKMLRHILLCITACILFAYFSFLYYVKNCLGCCWRYASPVAADANAVSMFTEKKFVYINLWKINMRLMKWKIPQELKINVYDYLRQFSTKIKRTQTRAGLEAIKVI